MEAFLVSISTVAIAEMGDRTQLLALMLAAHYRRSWPILEGVLCATLANHAAAGFIGVHLGRFLAPVVFLGKAFSERLPLMTIHYAARGLFLILGAVERN